MAENKKSFLLYADLIHTVKKMPKEKAGELLLTILEYVNDENPIVNDLLIEIAFEPIKQQLKRDLIKWDEIKGKRSEAGKASADARKQNTTNSTSVESVKQNTTNSTSVESVKQSSTNSTVTVNGSVSGTENENVKSTSKEKRVVAKKSPLLYYPECLDFWLCEFHKGWIFTGQTGKALKSIISKIKKTLKDSGNPEDLVVDQFKAMCNKLPEWYKDKDLSTIDSKFNEIVTEIKKNKNGNSTNKTSTKSSETIQSGLNILAKNGLSPEQCVPKTND